MVYSQAKVIAGGLAHIPIVIGVFYFIMTFFNKRALEYAEANKPKKPEAKKVVETKTESKPLPTIKAEVPKIESKPLPTMKAEVPNTAKKKHADVPVNIYRPKTCLLYTSPSPRD